MLHDISHREASTWAARTAAGMVFVVVGPEHRDVTSGADLVTLTDGGGAKVAARMIGPVAGEPPKGERWRVSQRYRVDPAGVPLASVTSTTAPAGSATEGHDWGAIGLPDGFDTRVLPADEPRVIDELTLARSSSGNRLGQDTPFLTLAPGDRVRVDGTVGAVIAVDRRKRTVEIDTGEDVQIVALDNVLTEETT